MNSEQRFLKRLDKIQNGLAKTITRLIYIFTGLLLLATVYFGICSLNGQDVGNRFTVSLKAFLALAAAGICAQLIFFGIKKFYQKDLEFDPRTMELPARGSVTLEAALHNMAVKHSVIAWDTTFATLLIILLAMMLFLGGNIPRILMICLILALLLISGHLFFTWRWKRRSFTGRMLKNTQAFLPVQDSRTYVSDIETSLAGEIQYYSKELILTEAYIIGMLENDFKFYPVAIKRSEITNITFFCKRPVSNPYRKFNMGILKCGLTSHKSVELMIGQGPKMRRALSVLNYYHIEWNEGETVYE